MIIWCNWKALLPSQRGNSAELELERVKRRETKLISATKKNDDRGLTAREPSEAHQKSLVKGGRRKE